MNEIDFAVVKEILTDLENRSGKGESGTYRHARGMPLQEEVRFECLVALYENGFVAAQDTSDDQKRELTAPAVTADGRDLLDAMRDEDLWARLEQRAGQRGIRLNLKTVKASVAETITGGFNA